MMASPSNSAPAHDDGGDDWMNAFETFIGPDADHGTTGGHPPAESSTMYTSARSHYQHQAHVAQAATVPAETQQHPVRFAHAASYSASVASSTVTSIPVATGNVLPVVPEVTVGVPIQQLPVAMQQAAVPPEDDVKALERSERKRCREKKRRTDANQQFSDLSALLRKIEESEEEDNDEGGSGSNKKQRSIPAIYRSSGNTNRIELVARAVAVLDRLHDENRRRGKQIAELKANVEEAKKEAEEAKSAAASQQHNPEKQDKVLMMVPMMVAPESIPNMGGAAGMGGGGGPGGSCMSAPMAMPMPNPMQQMMSQWSQAAFSPFPFMPPMGQQPASSPPATSSTAPVSSSSPPRAQEVQSQRGNEGQPPEGSAAASDNSHQSSSSTSADPSVPSSPSSNTEISQQDQSSTNKSSPSISRSENGKGSSSNLAHCA